jgi:glycine/D-amino acid oxidase-like deaminating enzyme
MKGAAGSCAKAMVSVFPQLANARVDYGWGGLVDMSMDQLVQAGEHDALFYSVGYSRHGVQMATYMGRQMAEYIERCRGGASLWRDIPFMRIPGHFGPPWFLPFAGRVLQGPGSDQVGPVRQGG